jgi:hypothetical protein
VGEKWMARCEGRSCQEKVEVGMVCRQRVISKRFGGSSSK